MKTRWMLLSAMVLISFNLAGIIIGQETSKPVRKQSRVLDEKNYNIIDINNIECYVQNDGTIGENPETGNTGFYFPGDQKDLTLMYTGGLWVIGKVNGDVRSAVSSYGTEYQPGRILSPGVAGDPEDPKYRVYKFIKGDSIDQEAMDQGCPDEVLGDQMLFCVYNDLKDNSDMWGGTPIGLEVQQTTYAFDSSGALGNTIFIKYHLVNKGSHPLEDAYIAMFFDADIGYERDDYTGCDSVLGIGFAYNGDGYDEEYGVQVPALGCDFVQGPIVPAPGQTAILPDWTEIPDSKILNMTAFCFWMNGCVPSGFSDPHTPQGGYYFLSGFIGTGAKWIDPTAGNRPTKFPFAGDPVTGTGWLFSSIASPTNTRFGQSSGPFDLDVGEYQEVTIALVVGQGINNLQSISVMKYFDQIMQRNYDHNFKPFEIPPSPEITLAEMENEMIILWSNDALDFEDIRYYYDKYGNRDSDAWEFEGYNIWQGETESGPWTRIATFDVQNGITTIRDDVYDAETLELNERTVQYGSDSGLVHRFLIEKDYLKDEPLISFKPYYFAVTAYAYNPEGIPKTLESEKVPVTGIPHGTLMDTEYQAATGDTIPVQHTGVSHGQVIVEVVDPAVLTGDEYTVTFFVEDDTESDYYGEMGWRLTNSTTGEILLDDQFRQNSPDENISVEGFLVSVFTPAPGFLGIIQVANPTYPEPLPESQQDSLGAPYGGNSVWLSPSCPDDVNHNGRYLWSHQSAYVGNLSACHDYELRWTDGVTNYNWAEWIDDYSFGKVPFELWDIGFATPNDAADDVQMLPICYANGATRGVWDVPNGSNVEDHWGYACSDRVYFYYPDPPYTYADFHAAAEAGDFGAADGMWGWVLSNGNRPLARLVVVNYDHILTGPGPAAGTVDRFITNKPNSPLDVFTFSTADYAPIKSAAIAKERLKEIQVFPNPYFCFNCLEPYYEGQFVTFNNLPEECTIRVFSLSGVLIKTIRHNNGTPFERWDLENASDKRVASGMYIVHVDTEFGDRILKLAVINRSL